MSELDPEIREMLDAMQGPEIPEIHEVDVDQARSMFDRLFAMGDDPDEVGEVNDRSVPRPDDESRIPVRVYTPEGGDTGRVLVWFHGGGFVLGDLETADHTARALCNRADCTVVSVDYRLAPEHPFPAAVEDAYAATQWTAENFDSESLVVGGDSAGATLSTVTSLVARDEREIEFDDAPSIGFEGAEPPSIDYQMLVYPATNYGRFMESYEENAEGYFLSIDDMAWFLEHYIENPIDGRNPYAFPLQANDLGRLPPATVVTCGFDPLRDEGREYVGRLEDAGVDVTHRSYDDAIHGILSMTIVGIERAEDVVNDVASDLEKV